MNWILLTLTLLLILTLLNTSFSAIPLTFSNIPIQSNNSNSLQW